MCFALLGTILSLASGTASAQNTRSHLPWLWYAGGGYADNVSRATIYAYDGAAQCGIFTQGNRARPSFWFGSFLPGWNDAWQWDARLCYRDLSTEFTTAAASTNTPSAFQQSTGTHVLIDGRDRLFDATLGMAALSASLSYRLLSSFHLSAGPYLGVLVRHSYSESERIASPSNAVYSENHLRTRTIGEGDLAVHAVQAGLTFEVAYELGFQPRLSLQPSLGFSFPFTSISDRSNSAWHIFPATLGLSLIYHPVSDVAHDSLVVDAPVPVSVPATVPTTTWDSLIASLPESPASSEAPKRQALRVAIKAFGVSDDGSQIEEPVLSIERMHVTEVYPMLHYVFFDDGESSIPSRYHQRQSATVDAFDERTLFSASALEIHHNVLDILGKRLRDIPTGTVTIVGTRSEHSRGDSTAGAAISGMRARSVANYLHTVWGIASERLKIKARSLPEVHSDDHNTMGEAENRRVEIVPSTPELTAPLRTERVERIATPPHINFDPEIIIDTEAHFTGIRSASILIKQRDHVLKTFDAITGGSVGEYLWTLDNSTMPDGRDSLTYEFIVQDSAGNVATASGSIQLRQQVRDQTIHAADTMLDRQLERFSLILFDYNSSQIERKEAESILREMASAVEDGSQVVLTGHTDRSGDDQYNDKLSEQRVTRASQLLLKELTRMGKDHPAMLTESHGSRDLLFDNTLPEGRVLSRTVRAIIQKDVR